MNAGASLGTELGASSTDGDLDGDSTIQSVLSHRQQLVFHLEHQLSSSPASGSAGAQLVRCRVEGVLNEVDHSDDGQTEPERECGAVEKQQVHERELRLRRVLDLRQGAGQQLNAGVLRVVAQDSLLEHVRCELLRVALFLLRSFCAKVEDGVQNGFDFRLGRSVQILSVDVKMEVPFTAVDHITEERFVLQFCIVSGLFVDAVLQFVVPREESALEIIHAFTGVRRR